MEPHKYGALQLISGILTFVGWALAFVGLITILFGLLNFADTQTNGPGLNLALGYSKLITGAMALVNGIVVIAVGQIIQLFIDIAQQTAVTADNSSKTVAFFERVGSRIQRGSGTGADASSLKEGGVAAAQEGVYDGYPWKILPDGSIETTIKGEKSKFDNTEDFKRYIRVLGPATPG